MQSELNVIFKKEKYSCFLFWYVNHINFKFNVLMINIFTFFLVIFQWLIFLWFMIFSQSPKKTQKLKNCVPYKPFVIAKITCTNKKCHIHPVYIYSSVMNFHHNYLIKWRMKYEFWKLYVFYVCVYEICRNCIKMINVYIF